MSLAHAPAAHAAAPSLARWEPSSPLFAWRSSANLCLPPSPRAKALTEPPGYARLFFIPVYAFLAWVSGASARRAFTAARAVPLLMALLAPVLCSRRCGRSIAALRLRRGLARAQRWSSGSIFAWRYDWKALLNVLAGHVRRLDRRLVCAWPA
jgi:hypothetical protein